MRQLKELTYETWHYYIFGNSTVLKAAVRNLYTDIVHYMQDVVSDDNSKKPDGMTLNYALYVTDTATMLPFLVTLGQKPNSIVDFASNIVVEMGVKPDSIDKEVKYLADY